MISYTPISYTMFCFYNIHSSVALHYKNWVLSVRAIFTSFSTVKIMMFYQVLIDTRCCYLKSEEKKFEFALPCRASFFLHFLYQGCFWRMYEIEHKTRAVVMSYFSSYFKTFTLYCRKHAHHSRHYQPNAPSYCFIFYLVKCLFLFLFVCSVVALVLSLFCPEGYPV